MWNLQTVRRLVIAVIGQRVVQQYASTNEWRRRLAPSPRRHDEPHLLDEVRSTKCKDATLAQTFPHDSNVILLEIPNAAVDVFRGCRARLGTEISSIEHDDTKTSAGCLAGQRNSRDATTNDGHIEGFGQRRQTSFDIECVGLHHRISKCPSVQTRCQLLSPHTRTRIIGPHDFENVQELLTRRVIGFDCIQKLVQLLVVVIRCTHRKTS